MISDKKVLEHAQAIVDYCRDRSLRGDNQRGIELKPCPFCGCAAKLDVANYPDIRRSASME